MDAFDWSEFEIGFWQAFGAFGGDDAEDIISTKQEQLRAHGWSLWSFSAGAGERNLAAWLQEIGCRTPWVLLGDSRNAAEPQGKQSGYRIAREYRQLGGGWQAVPREASTGFHGKSGAAYVVEEQSVLRFYNDQPKMGLSWFSTGAVGKGPAWDRARASLPPRPPTFMIARGGKAKPRRCSAVLKLKPPYLVQVR